MKESIIEFKQVSKRYDNNNVIEGLDLTIQRGEFFVLVGESGSGKSTTLKMINALTEPTEGNVYFNGQRIKDYDIQALRHKMGYVLQQIALFPTMTVQQNIALMPEILGWKKAEKQKRIKALLTLVGLNPEQYQCRYPNQLSGGEQQRIAILRAIAAHPDILLMDEAFSALDPLSRHTLQELLLQIHQQEKTTIVFVTHDMQEALKLGDRIGVMQNGRLVQVATPQEIQENPVNDFVRSLFSPKDYTLDTLVSAIAQLNPEEKAFIQQKLATHHA